MVKKKKKWNDPIYRVHKTVSRKRSMRNTQRGKKFHLDWRALANIYVASHSSNSRRTWKEKERNEGEERSKKSVETRFIRKGKDNDRSDVCSLTRLKSWSDDTWMERSDGTRSRTRSGENSGGVRGNPWQ